MGSYIVTLRGQKEITLGMQFGSINLTHGDIVYDSAVVRQFPQYFTPIPETFDPVKKEIKVPDNEDHTIKVPEESIEGSKVDPPKVSVDAPKDEKVDPPKINGAVEGKTKKKNLFQRG